jgi:two-component system cell cycle sensor histidine kinase PleC
MLINLLSNAVKFTAADGEIRVAARQLDNQDVELSVSDNGIGMNPDDIPTALSVFGQVDSSLTRKYEGTGLGLPLVKALIESHGGHMTIDAALGKGTTVSLIIPKRRLEYAATAAQ